jgi:hypothetical protein
MENERRTMSRETKLTLLSWLKQGTIDPTEYAKIKSEISPRTREALLEQLECMYKRNGGREGRATCELLCELGLCQKEVSK